MHTHDSGQASHCSQGFEKSVGTYTRHEDGLTREVMTAVGQDTHLAVGTSIVPGSYQPTTKALYQREAASTLAEYLKRPVEQNHVTAEVQVSAVKVRLWVQVAASV